MGAYGGACVRSRLQGHMRGFLKCKPVCRSACRAHAGACSRVHVGVLEVACVGTLVRACAGVMCADVWGRVWG